MVTSAPRKPSDIIAIKLGKVKVIKVTILWISFMITLLNTNIGVLIGTVQSIFPFFGAKLMRTMVILRIVSKAFVHQFSKFDGVAIGTPTVTPESIISKRGQPRVQVRSPGRVP